MPAASSLTRSLVFAALSLPACAAVAYSQQAGSGSSRSAPSRATRPQTPAEFYNNFWQHLTKPGAAYNTWKPLEHEPPNVEVENPHGTESLTYANDVAAKDPKNLPIGSILVREDYDDQRQRQSISVLYRVKDYDPEHGNWYYLRFTETGTVMKGHDNKPLAGKVSSCIDCHAKARGKDFVFSNPALEVEKTPNSETPTKE
ncbi:MAG: cytochrome P460 family protein [Planctomycetia bacterium]|nr:cytochrome P460 family protein [Planctomycetia bacterium]